MEFKNILDKILNSLISTYKQFASIIKNNGIVITCVSIILYVLLYSLVIYPINMGKIIDSAFDKQYKKEKLEQKRVEELREKAELYIHPVVVDLCENFKSVNKIMIFEKHNNTKNISGIDFLYFSSTFEYNDNDTLSYINDDFQRQYILNSFGVELIQELKVKEYIYFNDLKKGHHRILKKLYSHGIDEVIFIPIKNSKNQPLLIICIMGNKLNSDEIYTYFKPFYNNFKSLLIIED